MKAKEAQRILEPYQGNDLYQHACELFQREAESLIKLRAHGRVPTDGVVISAVKQTKDWFEKAIRGLSWDDPQTPIDIIKREASAVYVNNGVLDPEIEAYRRRTRHEMLRGSPFPLFEALTPKALDAMTGMMVARIQRDFRKLGELYDKRKAMAGKLGKQLCPYNEKERHCPYQETYTIINGLPRTLDDLVFVCKLDKCIKNSEGVEA